MGGATEHLTEEACRRATGYRVRPGGVACQKGEEPANNGMQRTAHGNVPRRCWGAAADPECWADWSAGRH